MAKRKPSKRKPLTKSKWIKKCDKEMSLLVREKNFCELSDISPCGGNLQHAHVYPKGHYPNLRFDILNSLCACYKHHLFFAHKDPMQFAEWFKQKFPERYAYLQIVRNEYRKFTIDDYKQIYSDIKAKNTKKLIYQGISELLVDK